MGHPSLLENPLVVVAAAQHPFAHQPHLSLETVLAQRFVIREFGSGTRASIEHHLRQCGKSYTQTLEVRSNENVKHAVAAGLGLGIVSLHTVQPEIDSGRLVVLDVEHFPINLHWYIVMRKGKQLSPVANAFKQFVMVEAARSIDWQ